VHSSGRRFTRVVIFGAIAAFAALPLFATSASAADTSAGVCTFHVLPNPVSAFPAQVHIEGTAPAGSTISAFSGSALLVTAGTDDSGNFHSANFQLNAATDVSANFTVGGSSYGTGCSDPEGLLVERVTAQAAAAQAQAQALAFTGSNNTTSFVLIGVTALIVGIVLTVGARRRSRISS
jgi:LPXTG-motif cell wall-anchored protein